MRRVLRTKFSLGLFAAVGLAAISLLLTSRALEAMGAENVHKDPLTIVIATSGAQGYYRAHVRYVLDTSGHMAMYLYFDTAAATDDPEAEDPFVAAGGSVPINYHVTFVGDEDQPFVCGTSADSIPRQPFRDLPTGTRSAMSAKAEEVQRAQNSATNTTQNGEAYDTSRVFPDFSGELTLMENLPGYYESRESGPPLVWVEKCELPDTSVWEDNSRAFAGFGTRRALRLPVTLFTSSGETTDNQRGIYVHSTIYRQDGLALDESYPQVSVIDRGWEYYSSVYWVGHLGQIANYGSTDQPVWFFSRTNSIFSQASFWVLIGLALGTAGTSLVGALSKALELWLTRRVPE